MFARGEDRPQGFLSGEGLRKLLDTGRFKGRNSKFQGKMPPIIYSRGLITNPAKGFGKK
jgi:hypothetical protein